MIATILLVYVHGIFAQRSMEDDVSGAYGFFPAHLSVYHLGIVNNFKHCTRTVMGIKE